MTDNMIEERIRESNLLIGMRRNGFMIRQETVMTKERAVFQVGKKKEKLRNSDY